MIPKGFKICKSKNRQHNDHKKKDKRTNKKTITKTPLNTRDERKCALMIRHI